MVENESMKELFCLFAFVCDLFKQISFLWAFCLWRFYEKGRLAGLGRAWVYTFFSDVCPASGHFAIKSADIYCAAKARGIPFLFWQDLR